jgi:hypothetical protein
MNLLPSCCAIGPSTDLAKKILGSRRRRVKLFRTVLKTANDSQRTG